MNQENQKKLNDRFGHLLNAHRTPNHALAMFGFECGDGWYNLLFNLLTDIENYFKTQPRDVVDSFSVQQIKEKFGTLRFYYSGDSEIEKFVSIAEDASGVTCELCGEKGKMRGGGWMSVKCHQHHLESIARLVIPQVQAYSEEYDYVSPYGHNKGQIEKRIRTKKDAETDMMYRVTKDLARFIKEDEDVSKEPKTEG